MDRIFTTEGVFSPRGLDFYEEPATQGKTSEPADEDEDLGPTIVLGRE